MPSDCLVACDQIRSSWLAPHHTATGHEDRPEGDEGVMTTSKVPAVVSTLVVVSVTVGVSTVKEEPPRKTMDPSERRA